MKNQYSLFIIFLLYFNFSFSQVFTSENGNFINLNNNKVKLYIEDTSYTGTFQSFTSKKDKKEYLIYSYFSRTVLITLDKPLNTFEMNTPNIAVKTVKLIHSNNIDSIIKTVTKKGVNNLKNFIIVYESSAKSTAQMYNDLNPILKNVEDSNSSAKIGLH